MTAKFWSGGGSSSDWFDGNNWSPVGVPGAGDIISIPASAAPTIGGNSLTFSAGVTNQGTITLGITPQGTIAPSDLVFSANTTLSGGGTVALTDTGNNRIWIGDGHNNPVTFENIDNTIGGSGQIFSSGLLSIKNDVGGVIDGSGTNNELQIRDFGNANQGTFVNDGIIRSSGKAGLDLLGATIDSTGGGKIEASGAGHFTINGGTLRGGTLIAASGGVIASANGTLDGTGSAPVTIQSGTSVHADNGNELFLKDQIANSGTIALGALGGFGILGISGTTVLNGSGAVTMSDNGNNRITEATGAVSSLENVDNHISGGGQIQSGANGSTIGLSFINDANGIVDGSSATTQLQIYDFGVDGRGNPLPTFTNLGIVEATGAAGINLFSGTIDSTGGGKIEANGAGVFGINGGGVLRGGSLSATNGGTFASGGGTLDGTGSAPVTIRSGTTVHSDNGNELFLKGQIANSGTIALGALGGFGILAISGATVLSGGGEVTMGDNGNNRITSDSATPPAFENVDNTITGGGSIADTAITFQNDKGGTIDATSAVLQILGSTGNSPAGTLVNDGSLEATGSGDLVITNTTIDNGSSGQIEALNGGLVQFNDAIVQGGTLVSSGGGTILSNLGTLDGTSGAPVTISTGSAVHLSNSGKLALKGAIVDDGSIALDPAAGSGELVVRADTTLSGTGTVVLSPNFNNRIDNDTSTLVTLDNGVSIEGSGQIVSNTLNLVNGPANGTATGGGTGTFKINVSYDSSVTALQNSNLALYNEYVSAVNAAVQFYESKITNPISITIDVGWGEVGGGALLPNSLATSSSNFSSMSYAGLRSLLSAGDTGSAVQQAAIASLSSADPTGGATFDVNVAEQQALGVSGLSGQLAGSIGLSSTATWSWSQGNIAAGTQDAVAAIEHEISEVMGRTATGGAGNQYHPLDLFRYTAADGLGTDAPGAAAGARDEPFAAGYNASAFSYFSYDGKTVTLPYNMPADVAAGSDVADWSTTVGGDAFGEGSAGVAGLVSAADLQELNVLGYNLAGTTGSGGGTTGTVGTSGVIDANNNNPSNNFGLLEIYINSFTNNGTLKAEHGGTLFVNIDSTHAFTNLNKGVLTGGNYEVVDNLAGGANVASVISFGGSGATAVSELGASTTVTLDGAGSHLYSGSGSPNASLDQSLAKIDAGATLNLNYGFNSQSAQSFQDAQALEVAGTVNLLFSTFGSTSTTIDSGGLIKGDGTITGAIIDDGIIETGSTSLKTGLDAVLMVSGAVGGTGSLLVDGNGTLDLAGVVASGVTVTFDNNALANHSETLKVEATTVDPAGTSGFAAKITGLTGTDVVDLTHIVASTSSFDGTILTLKDAAGKTVGSLDLSGLDAATGFKLVSDGHTGTDISVGTQAANLPPVITVPDTSALDPLIVSPNDGTAAAEPTEIVGVSIADADGTSSSETFTVTLTDTLGVLAAEGGTATDNGQQLVISGTLEEVNKALGTLTYATDPAGSTNLEDTISINVDDGRKGTDHASINVQPGDNKPVKIAAPDEVMAKTGEMLAITGVSLSDGDANGSGGPLSAETFTVTVSDQTGVLSAGGLDSGVNLTLKGTLAEVNAELAKLSYTDESTSSQELGSSETISITADDGRGSHKTKSITVDINNEPVKLAAPDEAHVDVNTAPTVSIAASITDKDGVDKNEYFTAHVTVASAGAMNGGVEQIASGSISGNHLDFSGDFAAMNQFLSGLTYTTSSSDVTSDTVTIAIDDGRGSKASQDIHIDINNEPVKLHTPGDQTTNVGDELSIPVGISDADGVKADETFKVTVSDESGTLSADGRSGDSISFEGNLADVQKWLGSVNYVASDVGTDTVTVTADDGRGSTDSKDFNVTVNEKDPNPADDQGTDSTDQATDDASPDDKLPDPLGVKLPRDPSDHDTDVPGKPETDVDPVDPPSPSDDGSSTGDPHIVTIGGTHYDFQAIGEFVLAKSADGLDVQERTQAYNGSKVVSVATEVAVKLGNHVITFDEARADPVWVDGQAVHLGGAIKLDPAAGTAADPSVGYVALTDAGYYQVVYNTGEVVDVVVNSGTDVDVKVEIPQNHSQIDGLLGNAPAAGVTQSDLYNTFADAWRVAPAATPSALKVAATSQASASSGDASLLNYAPGQTTATFTQLGYVPVTVNLHDLPVDVVARAAALADAAGLTNAELRYDAVYDYIVTGNPDFVAAARHQQDEGVPAVTNFVPPASSTTPVYGIAPLKTNVTADGSSQQEIGFEVYRTGDTTAPISLHYALVAAGTGFYGAADFGGTPPSGNVTIAAGEKTAIFYVAVPTGAIADGTRLELGISSSVVSIENGIIAPTTEVVVLQPTTAPTVADSAVALGSDGKSYINAANFNGGVTTLTGIAETGDAVVVRDAANNVVGAVIADATTGAWSIDVSGLTNGQAYSYVVTATDAAGSSASSAPFSFTVKTTTSEGSIADAAVTTGSDGKSYINAAHFASGVTTLTGVAEKGDAVVVKDAANNVVGTTTADAGTGAWSVNLSGLTTGQAYSYVATATDAAGNTASSMPFAFTVKTTTTEGAISDAAVTTGSDGKSYINAAHFNGGVTTLTGAAEKGDTVVVTDVANHVVGTTTADATTGAWSLNVSGLTGGQAYAYTATATDAAGNSASSTPFGFAVKTTALAPAVQAPANGSLTTNADPIISGTGEAGDHLTVKIDGTVAGTTTVLANGSWTFTPPTALSSGSHNVVASEVDVAGNVSALSNTDTFTVSALTETAPGAILATAGIAFGFSGSNGIAIADSSVSGETFKVVVSDTGGALTATGPGVTGAGSHSVTITGSSVSQVNAELASLTYTNAATGTDQIKVTASDSNGSTPVTKTIGVTVNPTEIVGKHGQFELDGTANADHITPDPSNVIIEAGAGNDVITLNPSNSHHFSFIDGGPGNDTLDLSHITNSVNVDLGLDGDGDGRGYATGSQIGANALQSIENIVGGSGNDTLIGSSRANRIEGGGGNDTMTGNGGGDTFVFKPNFGRDVITDFHVADTRANPHDVIEISKSIFADWSALQSAITDTGHGAFISANAHDTITLNGVTKAQLIASHVADFHFV